MDVRSDRSFRFEAAPADVWSAISSLEDYRVWWPWLREFDATALDVGDRWRCVVRPPLPYVLRFSVVLTAVVPGERIDAGVEGDIEGVASVTLRSHGDGTEVRLVSALAPRHALLRRIMGLTPWLARFGHDWVLDTGLRQFRRRAL